MPLLSWAMSAALAAPLPPIETFTLDNGLDVVLAPDTSTPIVAVNVWIHVGSRDEKPGLTGFAHLFEHLMFQGSPSNPGEYFAPLEAIGADINGSTNTDRTNYFEVLPARHLPVALWLEADRLGGLLDVLDQSWLDNQREVVRNERRQRYENTPYGEAMMWIQEDMYPEGHPYHHTTIGSHEDLERADLDAVRAFFRTWYVPNNATLVLAGDFDPTVARRLVEGQFGWIPRGAEPERLTTPPDVTTTAPAIRREYDDVPERKIWMAWHTPAADAPGDAELDLLTKVLVGGASTRLEKAIVREKKLATEVAATQISRPLGSLFLVTATAAPGHTTDEVAAAVRDVLQDVAGPNPPSAEELDGARASVERDTYAGFAQVGRRADLHNHWHERFGDPNGLERELDRYRNAEAPSVQEAARRLVGPGLELHILPKTDQPPEVAAAPAEPASASGCTTLGGLTGGLAGLGAVAVTVARRRGGAR